LRKVGRGSTPQLFVFTNRVPPREPEWLHRSMGEGNNEGVFKNYPGRKKPGLEFFSRLVGGTPVSKRGSKGSMLWVSRRMLDEKEKKGFVRVGRKNTKRGDSTS